MKNFCFPTYWYLVGRECCYLLARSNWKCYLVVHVFLWTEHFQQHRHILIKCLLFMLTDFNAVGQMPLTEKLLTSISFLGFPCIFGLLPDRKRITYQKLFQELKSMATSINHIFKPEQIVTDFESGLIPAISAEVKYIRLLLRTKYLISFYFSFRKLSIKAVIFIMHKLSIDASKLWV